MSPQTLLSHQPASHRTQVGLVRRRHRPGPAVSTPPAPFEHSSLLHDLDMARELQQGLLLQAPPRVPGWEIAATSLPATAIGGDLYDFIELDQTHYGIVIGDVSGHGLTAALRMAVARTLCRQAARGGQSPAATLHALNRALIAELPTGMVTLLYVVVDTTTGGLRISNAGHMFPVVIGNAVLEAEVAGLPLGINPDARYAEITLTLPPGDTLLLYTDGITEAHDRHGQMYDYHRLETLLLANRRQRPRTLLQTITNAVTAWSPRGFADDVSAVVVRRRRANFNDELRSVCADVLGAAGAAALWIEVADLPPNPMVWLAQLSQIGRTVQARHGSDRSRELIGQLRLVIDEYRSDLAPGLVGQP